MKRIALLTLMASFGITLSHSAFAAKFAKTPSMSNPAAQNLQKLAAKFAKNKDLYGDVGYVSAFDISGNESQEAIKTAKQLNHMKGNLNSDDDSGAEYNNLSATKIAQGVFEYLNGFDSDENEKAHQENLANLAEALDAVKADRELMIFGTIHSDEDGTWTILDIVDTKNNQILFIQFGYSGT